MATDCRGAIFKALRSLSSFSGQRLELFGPPLNHLFADLRKLTDVSSSSLRHVATNTSAKLTKTISRTDST